MRNPANGTTTAVHFPEKAEPPAPPRIALLACEVFRSEIAMLAGPDSRIQIVKEFEIGLHDRPNFLRETLQREIDALDDRDDIDAIVLVYGLCGRGTAGLRARKHRLVIPRAHDCITVFMGSKERYAEHQRSCPSCFYYTPGWNKSRRVPGPDRMEALKAEFEEKFDPENAAYLLDMERSQWTVHDTVTYLDLGTGEADGEADYAMRCAEWLGWKYERLRGNPALLRDLMTGNWHDIERFQVVEPGNGLGHASDERILLSES